MQRALIVVAKAPSVGQTKTRLSPPLSGLQAAELYRAFLLDTLDLMHNAAQIGDLQPFIAYLPPTAEGFFRSIAPPGFKTVPQMGNSLGERLHNVLRHCLQSGYDQAVVMDSDSPTLPADYLLEAFGALDDQDVDLVLGPCEDGGYYLIGLKSPCSALFEDIVMSTATVMQETLQRARQEQLRPHLLPTWYDIDTPRDLERLRESLACSSKDVARYTREYLGVHTA